jgi:hypothetical protein
MTVASTQELATEVEARFAHLLQPIKDLAQNWNIDIASELEEYLEQVIDLLTVLLLLVLHFSPLFYFIPD